MDESQAHETRSRSERTWTCRNAACVRAGGMDVHGSSELENYPSGWDPSHGRVLLYAVGVAYMFLALALVCDEYFVPALEVLAHKLGVPEDVAGATFMAAGGSAPELATGLLGTFVSHSNVGVGTIVGSAAFNVLFVTGACAFYAKKALRLHWYPILRDSSFYALDLSVLAVFFASEAIRWWHSCVLLLLYAIYITVVFMDKSLRPIAEGWARSRFGSVTFQEQQSIIEAAQLELQSAASTSKSMEKVDLHLTFQRAVKRILLTQSTNPARRFQLAAEIALLQEYLQKEKRSSGMHLEKEELQDIELGAIPPNTYLIYKPHEVEDTPEQVEGSPMDLNWPRSSSKRHKLWFLIKLPVCALLYFTLPEVQESRASYLLALSFLGSIFWICVFAYLTVWWTTVIGVYLGISTTVLGITMVAAGSSVPDLITSLIVARKGYGDMAISSSIGSNIFDVTVGLPLPWLLHSLFHKGKPIFVHDMGLDIQVVVLLVMIFLTILTVSWCKWKLSHRMGLAMLGMYGVYLVSALFFELLWAPS